MGSLEGKAVVITGSGGGIGAAYARLAVHEGAAVVVNDLDQGVVDAMVAELVSRGGRATGVAGSVADPDVAERLVSTSVQAFGALDGLVNNAGVMVVGPPDDVDVERARGLLEVNVLGTVLCGAAAIRQMRRQGHGSIVNVTSGAHMGLAATAVYGASKGATAALTYDWATDLVGTGIRVNAVSPMASTQMAVDVLELQGSTGDELTQRLAGFPTAEDNAPVAIYLLSDLSSAVHGQVVRIDGGELSLVSRPAIMRPSLTRDGWTVPDVAAAFDGELAGLLNPVGLLEVVGDVTFRSLRAQVRRPEDDD
ncbi:MAG: SDR family NAD(P)-dependent oxidoreductase [Aeromicrobium erythreum]